MQLTILLMTNSGKIQRAPNIQDSREVIHSQVTCWFSDPAEKNIEKNRLEEQECPYWNLGKQMPSEKKYKHNK